MKVKKIHILYCTLLSFCSMLISCNNDMEEVINNSKGQRATIEGTLMNMNEASTRANGSYDGWAVTSFVKGDEMGIYASKGRQNPANDADFSIPLNNDVMYFEGNVVTSSSMFRFGNSEIILDPTTLSGSTNYMYYPYYKDMPVPYDKTVQPGMPMRVMDNGILKYRDFLYASSMPLSNGVIQPQFYHHGTWVKIHRGEGFDEPADPRIWVVLEKPITDLRITQSSSTSSYSVTLQYNPTETEEELMVELPGITKFKVNKYCLYECWPGNNYSSKPTDYAMVPSGNTMSYIIIQDNFGNWQYVTDFYTYQAGTKSTRVYDSLLITISLKGLDVTTRTVTTEKWDDEIEITDDRSVGISNDQEYYNWATLYNSYIEENRDPSKIEQLKAYGDARTNTATNETEWTFYINGDIKFRSNLFAKITRLEDKLEGSSTYKNYEISGILGTMFGEMGPKGGLNALDFNEIYIKQNETDNAPFSPLIGKMEGGLINNCKINNAIVISHSPVGLVAGSVLGGSIVDCIFSGDAIGTSSASVNGITGLFGTVSTAPTLTNVKTVGLKFIQN